MTQKRESSEQPTNDGGDNKRAKITDIKNEDCVIKEEGDSVEQKSQGENISLFVGKEEQQKLIDPLGAATTVVDEYSTPITSAQKINQPVQFPTPQRLQATPTATTRSATANKLRNANKIYRSKTPPTPTFQTLSMSLSPRSPNHPRSRRHLKPLSESEQHQKTKALLEKLRPKYAHNNYPVRRPQPTFPIITRSQSGNNRSRKPDTTSSSPLPPHVTFRVNYERDVNFTKRLYTLKSFSLENFVESGKGAQGDAKADHSTLLSELNKVSKYRIFRRVDIDVKTLSILKDHGRWKEDKYDLDVKRVLKMKDGTDETEEEWRNVLGITPMKKFKDFI